MPRLDPAHPPLWRTPTTLQFGANPVAVVTDPAPWQERLVHELERGVPDAALDTVATALGAPQGAAAGFVRRIADALAQESAPAPRCVLVQATHDAPPACAEVVAEAFTEAGFAVAHETWFGVDPTRAPDASLVVVVAHHLVEPRRAADLMRRDETHLPIVFSGDRAEVGPLVEPGLTACLACIAGHHRDADPAWPLLAAQLLGRPAPAVPRMLALEAGLVATRLLNDAEKSGGRQGAHSVTLHAGSLRRTTLTHLPHAECRCRSLEGTATPPAPVPLAPTTATAFALPA